MSNEGIAPEFRPEPHFFNKSWFKRLVAMALSIAMVSTLVVPALPGRANADAGEPASVEEQSDVDRPAVANISDGNDASALEMSVSDAFLIAYLRCEQALNDGAYLEALAFSEECLSLAVSDEETVTALAEKGNVLFLLGRYSEAEDAYLQILATDAIEAVSEVSLYSRLAQCRLLEGKIGEAMQSCELAFQAAEQDDLAELYALRGVILFYGENYEAAKSDFQTALELGYEDTELLQTQIDQCDQLILIESEPDPETSAAASYSKPEPSETETNAAKYYFAGDYRQAAEEFRKLLGKSYYYTDMQLYSNIAKCQYQLGDYAGAVESCTAGLKQKGNDERAALYTLRGSARMALGESALAAADFESAIKNGAANPKLNALQAAICYYFSDDFARCIEIGTPLIDTEGYEEAAMWVALSRYMMGEYASAADLLARSVELDQTYCRKDELYRLKARCELQLGEFTDVIESASLGLIAGAESGLRDAWIESELYNLRGSAYLSVGQYKAALDDLKTALEISDEESYDLLTQITLCSFLLGNYNDTVDYGSRAMEAGEPTADLCYWVGLAGFSTQQYEKARKVLLKCCELDETKENIWFYIGVCSFSMEDYETAIGQFTSSIDAGEPAAARSLYNRAICYLQVEEYKKAKADLEAAAESDSPDVAADAADLLSSLKSVLG